MKHFLSLKDVSAEEFKGLLSRAAEMKSKRSGYENALQGKVIGLLFSKKSTRTRVSFETGIALMGGRSLFISSTDTQISRGEPVKDTARVLSRYLSALVIRTYEQKELEDFVEYGSIPVVNALTDFDHPCQAIADFQTIQENFGDRKIKLTYVGDGNNVAHALMFGCALLGHDFTCLCPPYYPPLESCVKRAQEMAKASGAKITISDHRKDSLTGASVVYTDTWISMGQEEESDKREKIFAPFQVNSEMMALANKDAIFMHDLPAYRGKEVTDEVMEASYNRIWDQAENRMWGQMALLEAILGTKSEKKGKNPVAPRKSK